jgi:hypothetical protein
MSFFFCIVWAQSADIAGASVTLPKAKMREQGEFIESLMKVAKRENASKRNPNSIKKKTGAPPGAPHEN